MRTLPAALVAILLASAAYAAPKAPFDAAAFAKNHTSIDPKGGLTQLTKVDWDAYNAAYAKCASSKDGKAFVNCMNALLKDARFSIKREN